MKRHLGCDTAFRTGLQGWISHSGKMPFQAVQQKQKVDMNFHFNHADHNFQHRQSTPAILHRQFRDHFILLHQLMDEF